MYQEYEGAKVSRSTGTQRPPKPKPQQREAEHGREAMTPSEIPAPGWKDILLRVYHGVSEDRIMALAAASTYYVLLAIFPALAALVAIYGLFADPSHVGDQ